MREVYELNSSGSAVRFHMVSLHPTNPKNSPDSRKSQALKRLEAGEAEVFWKEALWGPWFRYLAPLKYGKGLPPATTSRAIQLGDVIGGITVYFDVTMVEEALATQRLII